MLFKLLLSTCALGATVSAAPTSVDARPNTTTVVVLPNTFAALGSKGPFRGPGQLFNPTNTTAPFFQIFDPSFTNLLPQNPFIVPVTQRSSIFPIAVEAPVYNPTTNELFFASSLTFDTNKTRFNNRLSKVNLTVVENALESGQLNDFQLPYPQVVPTPYNALVNINGATGPLKGSLVFATRGRWALPSSLVLINPTAPFINNTVLVDNFFGRQFNSINDVKIHNSGKIFFTDTSLGYLDNQKPAPQLPNQVYAIDPVTRLVKVVADQLELPNGLAFSTDGNTAFVSDTGLLSGTELIDYTNNGTVGTSTIYEYDVDPRTLTFKNRRVFAYVDAGVPDGLQVDTNDNLYAATADGVQVFNKNGTLIGKIFLGSNISGITFAGPDSNLLVILARNSVYVASIIAKSNLIVS